jgi:hypothetical protein
MCIIKMSSQYAKLGNACNGNTVAITNNDKYIKIDSKVYDVINVQPLYYPGHSQYFKNNLLYQNEKYPEELKAYDIPDSSAGSFAPCKSCSTK